MSNEKNSVSAGSGEVEDKGEKTEKMVLALKDDWKFIPSEGWKVDVCGTWSDVGTDESEQILAACCPRI